MIVGTWPKDLQLLFLFWLLISMSDKNGAFGFKDWPRWLFIFVMFLLLLTAFFEPLSCGKGAYIRVDTLFVFSEQEPLYFARLWC